LLKSPHKAGDFCYNSGETGAAREGTQKSRKPLLLFKKKKQENTYFWGFASHSGEGAKKKCFLTRFFLKKVGAFALFFETRGRVCGFCERFFFEKKNQETFDV